MPTRRRSRIMPRRASAPRRSPLPSGSPPASTHRRRHHHCGSSRLRQSLEQATVGSL
jgi:hypothetical protein